MFEWGPCVMAVLQRVDHLLDGSIHPAYIVVNEFSPVDAGERLHQRGFAVIDVAGRAHDDVLHPLMFIVLPDSGARRSIAMSQIRLVSR